MYKSAAGAGNPPENIHIGSRRRISAGGCTYQQQAREIRRRMNKSAAGAEYPPEEEHISSRRRKSAGG
ncbi:hypothetical protein ACFOGI_03130 [Virgibacillus xinjiangensis]|uniref:Uncharacterized protein n=1 Tax=Virgibacillus xinjiangensis TaxID=393090 RepID=A0ABV7CSB3_9BACI